MVTTTITSTTSSESVASEAPSSSPAHPLLSDTPVVAVDCNGADLGPGEVAAGAALAAAAGARCILFGPASELGEPPPGVEVIDAPVSIAKSCRSGDRRSLDAGGLDRAGRRAVADGRAQALVCAGGTGAALAAGLFNIKRTRGIYRPALAIPLPVPHGPVTLLDVGANALARREHLVQFAFMGAALSSTVLGVERPRVGLLSNGEESARGSALVVEAHAELLLRAGEGIEAFEFVGNVEGGDLMGGRRGRGRDRRLHGQRRAEGDGGRLADDARRDQGRGDVLDAREAWRGAAARRPGGFRAEIDPEMNGGAYLLGLRRLGVVPHGRFSRTGFAQAILRAERGAREDIVGRPSARWSVLER